MIDGHVASYVYIDNGETNSNNMYVGGNPYLRIAISRLKVCSVIGTLISLQRRFCLQWVALTAAVRAQRYIGC